MQFATIPVFSPLELLKINHAAFLKARAAWLVTANAGYAERLEAADFVATARTPENIKELSKVFPFLLQESDTIKKHVTALERASRVNCSKEDFRFFCDALCQLLKTSAIPWRKAERDFLAGAEYELFTLNGDNITTLGAK